MPGPRQPPLQFSLAKALVLVTVLALVFAVLRWLGVQESTSLIVIGLLGASALAAVLLVLVIAASTPEEDEPPERGKDEQRRED